MNKKYLVLFAVVTVLISAMMFFACGETEQGAGSSCQSTFDCNGGEVCDPITKTCKFLTFCSSDDACDYAYYCANSSCTPAVDCPTGVECANITTSDGRAVSCQEGYCLPGTASVTDGDTGNQTGCNTQGCPYGYTCNTSNGVCMPNSADGDYGTVDGDDVDGDAAGDPCDPNPCAEQNKAVCNDDGSGNAVCTCNDGYHDESGACVENTTNDPCTPNPCSEANKTACVDDGLGGHICNCDVGYHDESGTCVVNGSTGGTDGNFCQTLPAATTGYDPMCLTLGSAKIQASAESCGTCTGLVIGQTQHLGVTDCSGNELMGGDLDPLSDVEDYIFALRLDPNDNTQITLTILSIDKTQATCSDFTYQDVLANLGSKSGYKIVEEWSMSIK